MVPPNFTREDRASAGTYNAVTPHTAGITVEVYSAIAFRFAAPRLLHSSPDETLPPSVSLYARVEKNYSFFSQPLNMTDLNRFYDFTIYFPLSQQENAKIEDIFCFSTKVK